MATDKHRCTQIKESEEREIVYDLSVTVEAIKDLIEHLPPDDRAALAGWIGARDRRDWDAEIERDFSEGGAGMGLLEEVDALIDSGNVSSFRISRPKGLTD